MLKTELLFLGEVNPASYKLSNRLYRPPKKKTKTKQKTDGKAVISSFPVLFVLRQNDRTGLFLFTQMTGSANDVEMTILK